MDGTPTIRRSELLARRKGAAPRARNTDPGTSHAAAASVQDVTRNQEAVLEVLRHHGPQTDEEIVRSYQHPDHPTLQGMLPQQSESGIRTRRRELADMTPPLVQDSGEKKELESGRKAIIWVAEGGEQGSLL
jgi:uncharacterized protein involved in exopolysaccharide biosynthesis